MSGRIGVPDVIANQETRHRYLQSSLMEEAVTSSLLEGAATTRAEAREMLRTRRPPRNEGERMVLGNYRAMEFIRDHVGDSLTLHLVLELHRRVMLDTDAEAAGRLRRADEDVRVEDHRTGRVLHRPPPAEELPARLDAMCAFANETGGAYIPPVVRAMVLHFWLAYDHPFKDGNGRTARALFYWAMLRQGY